MRLRSRHDANHVPITAELQRRGFYVVDLSHVGGGCPDLLVVWPCGYALLELKTPKGKLNDKQSKFHDECRQAGGHIHVVRSVVDALAAIGVLSARG